MTSRLQPALFSSPPVRVGFSVIAGFAALLAILFAVRPDMAMSILHKVMSMM